MDTKVILELLKDRLGIKHSLRDTYLQKIIEGIVSELSDEKGITLENDNMNHILFIVDYAAFRFEKPNDDLPRNMKFRMHNLIIHNGGDANV